LTDESVCPTVANRSGTLLTGAVQVIIEMKAIEVPYRLPTAEEEKSA
jgi:hypothetical protein